MAVSTTFSGPKLESLFLKSSSRLPTPTHLSVFGKPRTTFIQKGIIRCDAQNSDQTNNASPTPTPTLSALELLKTSAADSMSMLHFIFHIVYFSFVSLFFFIPSLS